MTVSHRRSANPSLVPAMLRVGAFYFLLVFAAGFLLGLIRVPFVVPAIGVRSAELLEMPLMLLVIVCAARWLSKNYGIAGNKAALVCGITGLLLMLASELLMVTLVLQRSLIEHLSSRDPVSGCVYLAMLLVFALMPLILLKVRAR